MTLNIRKRDAYTLYMALSGVASLSFALAFTVNLVYQVRIVGLDPLQMVLVGTVLEATALTFEVPTGIVADIYSRRLSIVIGYCLLGLGIAIQALIPVFEMMLLSSFVSGVGWTFISGASDAWLVDEVGQERAGKAFIRASQVGSAASIVGIIISVLLASIDLRLPIVLGGVIMLIGALTIGLMMPEEGFTRRPPEERQSLGALFSTLRDGVGLVRGRPLLITLLLIEMLFGAFSEGLDRLWTPHLLENFSLPPFFALPEIIWFGVISIVSMLLGIAVTEIIRRRLNLNNHRQIARTLAMIYGLMACGVLAFALSGQLWLALAAYWLIGALRGSSGAVYTTWINQHIESNVRATVLSLYGQANALGQIAGGPGVGFVGRAVSLRAALATSAVLLLPSLPLFARSSGQGKPQPLIEEAAA